MAHHTPYTFKMNITSISLATQILCVIVITIFVSSRYVIKQRLRLFFGVEDGGFTALFSGNMLRDPLSTVLHCLGTLHRPELRLNKR